MQITRNLPNRRKSYFQWMLFALMLVLVLPVIPYIYADISESSPAVVSVPNPGSDLWREVRQRDFPISSSTQISGIESNVLIDSEGQKWREYRIEKLIPYGAYILGAMLGVFLVYFLIRGRIPIKGGRSGIQIPRFTQFARWVHWITAISFMILAFTGLVLMYGKYVLIPLLGPEGIHIPANLSKLLHDFSAPVFIVGLVFTIFTFMRESLINFKVDTMWFLRAGGYLGGKHPSAEKVNAGQKLWYWSLVFGGIAIVASGLVMYFPNIIQDRLLILDAHIIHTIASIFLISFMIVHIYLASFGVEGALECMTSGYCDANWAKEHHDLWYEEMQKEGKVGTRFEDQQKSEVFGQSQAADS